MREIALGADHAECAEGAFGDSIPAVKGQMSVEAALAALGALERRLRDSEAERRALFETATCGRAYADPETGRVLHASLKLRQITGYSSEELRERTWLDLLVEDDRRRHAAELERLTRGHVREVCFEARCLHKSGDAAWTSVWAVLVRDESWRPLRTVVSFRELPGRATAPAAS